MQVVILHCATIPAMRRSGVGINNNRYTDEAGYDRIIYMQAISDNTAGLSLAASYVHIQLVARVNTSTRHATRFSPPRLLCLNVVTRRPLSAARYKANPSLRAADARRDVV